MVELGARVGEEGDTWARRGVVEEETSPMSTVVVVSAVVRRLLSAMCVQRVGGVVCVVAILKGRPVVDEGSVRLQG